MGTHDQLGVRALSGKSQAGAKGLVELVLYKMQALNFFAGEWLDGLQLDASVKSTIRAACAGISHFREMAGYSFNPEFTAVSHSWRAGWTRPAEAAFELVEAPDVRKNTKQDFVSLSAAPGLGCFLGLALQSTPIECN